MTLTSWMRRRICETWPSTMARCSLSVQKRCACSSWCQPTWSDRGRVRGRGRDRGRVRGRGRVRVRVRVRVGPYWNHVIHP